MGRMEPERPETQDDWEGEDGADDLSQSERENLVESARVLQVLLGNEAARRATNVSQSVPVEELEDEDLQEDSDQSVSVENQVDVLSDGL